MNKVVKLSIHAVVDDSIIERLGETITNNPEVLFNISSIPKISRLFGGDMKLVDFSEDDANDPESLTCIGCAYEDIPNTTGKCINCIRVAYDNYEQKEDNTI